MNLFVRIKKLLTRKFEVSGVVTELPAGQVCELNLTGDADRIAITAVDGSFKFEGLSRGTYVVTPSLVGHTFRPAFKTVTVRDADIVDVNFVDPPVFNRFLGVQATSNRGGVRR